MPQNTDCKVRPSVAAHEDHIHVAYYATHFRINYQELEKQRLDPRVGWKCPKCNRWSRLDCEKCQYSCKYGIRAPLLPLTVEVKCMFSRVSQSCYVFGICI